MGLFDLFKKKKNEIPYEQVEGVFANMKAHGVNTNAPMLYGYFFTNPGLMDLERAAEELRNEGFEFVDIHQDENKMYWLHMEKTETHNSKSLFKLNQHLYAVADKYKLNSYDGFDIGNADKNKPIDHNTYAVPEQFGFSDYMQEGYPMLIIVNLAFDHFPHKKEFIYFIKINTGFEYDDNSMLPHIKELDRMENIENDIVKQLTEKNIKNYYVFRETYKGFRNFYITTNNKDSASGVLQSLRSAKNNFEFEVITDPEWGLYEAIKSKMSKD